MGGLDQAFIEGHVLGAEAYLERARQMSLEDAARVCGLEAGQIRQLTEMYHTISPAVICPGNGPERNRNGGSGLRAVFALPALAGKFGVLGGGLLQGASASFPKTLARLQGEDLAPQDVRTLNIVTIGRDLLDPQLKPPIKGLFIYNHNAVIVHPDQNTMRKGLLRRDLFTSSVTDIVKTDTVLFADVVLPASSHFEYPDLCSIRPAFPAAGRARNPAGGGIAA
jgi:anaerobic selenocysteine-containing dehydrogenase